MELYFLFHLKSCAASTFGKRQKHQGFAGGFHINFAFAVAINAILNLILFPFAYVEYVIRRIQCVCNPARLIFWVVLWLTCCPTSAMEQAPTPVQLATAAATVQLATAAATDKLWLGRTVAVPEFDGACVKKLVKAGPIRNVRFSEGDYAIGIQWYERLVDSEDGERREFEMHTPCIDVQNSTELRLVVTPEQIGGAHLRELAARQERAFRSDEARAAAEKAAETRTAAEMERERRRKWRVSAPDIAHAHGQCWDPTSGDPRVTRTS